MICSQWEIYWHCPQVSGAECDHYGAVWSPWCLWPETASRWLTEPPPQKKKQHKKNPNNSCELAQTTVVETKLLPAAGLDFSALADCKCVRRKQKSTAH